MQRFFRPSVLLASICLISIFVDAGRAQAPALAAPVVVTHEEPLTAESVQQRIDAVRGTESLAEETKNAAIEIYESALGELQRQADRRKQADANQQLLERAPTELAEIERRLKELPTEPEGTAPGATIDQLQAQLASVQADLTKNHKTVDDISARLDRRPQQIAELPGIIDQLNQRAQQIRTELSNPPSAADPPEIVEAKQVQLEARLAAVQADIDAAKSDRLVAQNAGNLFSRRRDFETKRGALLERQAELIQDRISKLEEAHQKELARKALFATASNDPRIQAVIAQNRTVASDYNNTDFFKKRQSHVAGRLNEIDELTEKITEDEKRTKKRLAIAGPNAAVNSMMRASWQALPDPRLWYRRAEWAGDIANETAILSIELNEAVQGISDIDAKVVEILGSVSGEKTHERLAQEEVLRGHLQTQKELYQAAATAYEKLLNDMTDYSTKSRNLIQRINEYSAFLAERILWVPSTNAITKDQLPVLWEGVQDLVSPGRWLVAWDILYADLVKSPSFYVMLAAGLVVAVVARRPIRKRLRHIGDVVAKDYVGTPHLTLVALSLTVAIAGVWPLELYLLSSQILRSTAKIEVLAIASALGSTAAILFLVDFMRQACRPSGLAITHFRWRAASVAVLRRNLRWLTLVLLPLAFMTAILMSDTNLASRTSMIRILFMVDMIILSVLLYRTLHRSSGVAESLMSAGSNSWTSRLRIVWFPLIVLLPLSLAIFAAIGYVDSAILLNNKLLYTLSLALGVVVINSVMLRWLYAVRGQLAISQGKKRREMEAAQAEDGAEPVPPEQTDVDLSVVNAQTRRMQSMVVIVAVMVGLFFIWSDTIPALRSLDNIAFWSKTEYAWEAQRDEETGSTHHIRVEKRTPVTLATFGVVAFMGFITVAAARNLPGLLEVTILSRLPIDGGARFAITTVARYIISMVGLLLCTSQLGIRWDSVQWLAAAFTVGLGFGLQEIVANFVSGLILLLERPIRIGDVVTVGDVHGKVTRIQIRATTITNWERKELIVPNKEFITGQFVNWTLTDRILRVDLQVGVAYDSDLHKVERILMGIVRRHPHVVRDPEPRVIFDQFGDSTLNFKVYAFVENIDFAVQTRHEMNMSVRSELQAAGIEIAFPQRDVNLHFNKSDELAVQKIADSISAIRKSA